MEINLIKELLSSNDEAKIVEVVELFKESKPQKELLTAILIAYCVMKSGKTREDLKDVLLKIAPSKLKNILTDDEPYYKNVRYNRRKGSEEQRIAKYLEKLPVDDKINPIEIAIKTKSKWGVRYIFSKGDLETQREFIKNKIKDGELRLDHNDLESLPDVLSEFQEITVLDLRLNKLQSFPLVVTELKNLKNLFMGSSGQIKSLPPEIAKLKNLEGLFISDTQLSELPDEIEQLDKLERINLINTKFKEFPKQLFKVKNLKQIAIQPCKPQAGFRDQLLKLEKLENIECAKEWSANIPEYHRPFEGLK